MTASEPRSPGVRKRRVYYLSGFDPRGPAPYHTLYREEAAKQGAVNGYDLEVGPRTRKGRLASSWEITLAPAGPSGDTTVTDYNFLRWDDIIRDYWPKNEAAMLRSSLPLYIPIFLSGLILKYLRSSWPMSLTFTYPIVALILFTAGGALLGATAATLLTSLFSLPLWVTVPLGLLLFAASIALGRRLEGTFHSYWLLRSATFTFRWGRRGVPALEERLDAFADHIIEEIRAGDDDEVLLIGHSIGSTVAIPLMARILEKAPDLAEAGPALGLVTLGNCLPLTSYHPEARAYRDHLTRVATAPSLTWFDFSARRDGACFALVDTVATSGIERPAGAPVRPVAIPARFWKMFSTASYARIKRDVFRLHFQYLMAAEEPNEYDYFAITAGPMTLSERFTAPAP